MSCCENIQYTWCLFCLFCDYWFEIINYIMQYIYMCYKWLACESKMASTFNSGQFSGLPTEPPTISIPESSGLPTELPSELPIISVYGSSEQPYLHGKIAMGSPLHCPLSCPLFYTPVFRRDVLWYGDVRPGLRPSVRLSVRPTLRPSVRVSVRPFSALFSYMLWHIELTFCTLLCFDVLQIKFNCRHFASIF